MFPNFIPALVRIDPAELYSIFVDSSHAAAAALLLLKIFLLIGAFGSIRAKKRNYRPSEAAKLKAV